MTDQPSALNNRAASVDALRGLAMFLILAIDIGGARIFQTFTNLWGENFANATVNQFRYEFTEGLRLCFIAMPMFLLVVGLVIPFSMSNRVRASRKKTYNHIFKRALILFVLGEIAGGHLLHLKFANMPLYNNILEYIAIGYLVCSIIVLKTKINFQIILTAALLVIYYLIFLIIPVPGGDGEPFSAKMNLAIYIDNLVLGAHHSQGSWQILATISFIANMLIGVLMGHLLFSNRDQKEKTKQLFIWGFGMLIAGVIWGFFFPVIRSLWSSSFVLETCGITTLVLAIFYYLIDVKGYSKWAFFFIVFGVNSIAIYMMAHLFDFKLIGNIVIGGFSELFNKNLQNFIQAMMAMAVMWLIVYFMYRKKIFIKV